MIAIGKNINEFSFLYQKNKNGGILNVEELVKIMENGFVDKVEGNNTKGLRTPQLGALYSFRSHWTVSNESFTILLPTATVK